MDNSAESVISMFGILKAGGIFIMVNSTMKARKVSYVLQNSGVRALISYKNKFRIVKDAVEGCPDLRAIIWAADDI